MIAWANYAGDLSKQCLRVVAIKAWKATKNKFQGSWSVHLGLKLHWFIRVLYGAEFLTIVFKKLSRVLLVVCGKKIKTNWKYLTFKMMPVIVLLVPCQYVFMFSFGKGSQHQFALSSLEIRTVPLGCSNEREREWYWIKIIISYFF